MIRRLERQRLSSDLAAVEDLLRSVPEDDVIGRLSLEHRKDEVSAQLKVLDDLPDTRAHAALFFGGEPVKGSQGIDADFAAKALAGYQDLVVKVWSSGATGGPLPKSGPVPLREAARLQITGVLRGSFGFELAELEEPESLPLFPLRRAVEDATRAIMAATQSDDALADAALDTRSLSALGEFFSQLRKARATLKIVSGELEQSLSSDAIEQAADRTEASTLTEDTTVIHGTFGAVLPEARKFEFRADDGRLLTGRVAENLESHELGEMNRKFAGHPSNAELYVTTLVRGGRARSRYVLLKLSD